MICAEHGCPTDQCGEFKHIDDECDETARLYVKGLARGIELAMDHGVRFEERRTEIMSLLRFIRERL